MPLMVSAHVPAYALAGVPGHMSSAEAPAHVPCSAHVSIICERCKRTNERRKSACCAVHAHGMHAPRDFNHAGERSLSLSAFSMRGSGGSASRQGKLCPLAVDESSSRTDKESKDEPYEWRQQRYHFPQRGPGQSPGRRRHFKQLAQFPLRSTLPANTLASWFPERTTGIPLTSTCTMPSGC